MNKFNIGFFSLFTVILTILFGYYLSHSLYLSKEVGFLIGSILGLIVGALLSLFSIIVMEESNGT